MGSMSNPNTWAPYGTYKDCSQGICSIYCPQWCYMIFPPPPPPFGPPDDDSDTNFSPLIIGVIGILASAFLLISYYTLISKYCTRTQDQNLSTTEIETNRDQINQENWQVGSTGLDEADIKSITVCNYNRKDGLIEGTECSVCLNEFQENERLRLLPKCNHAFHLPCIDTWLKSHSNCPLCRSNVTFTSSKLPSETPSSQTSSTLNISSLEIQRGNDLVLVVDDSERRVHHGEVVQTLVSEVPHKNEISNTENSEISIGLEGVQQFRRSISLGSFACRGHLLVADILRISEEDEDMEMEMENSKFSQGIGPSTGEHSKINGSIGLKRSISTGRFMFTGHDKGKISILPR